MPLDNYVFAIALGCGVVASLLYLWRWLHGDAEMRRRGFRDARFEPLDSILVFCFGGGVFLLVIVIGLAVRSP